MHRKVLPELISSALSTPLIINKDGTISNKAHYKEYKELQHYALLFLLLVLVQGTQSVFKSNNNPDCNNQIDDLVWQLCSKDCLIRQVVFLLQLIHHNSSKQTRTVHEVDDDDRNVFLGANAVCGDALTQSSNKDSNAGEDRPNDLHEDDEDPESSVIAKFAVLPSVEDESKHDLDEASVEHNWDHVVDGKDLLAVQVKVESPESADDGEDGQEPGVDLNIFILLCW